MILLLRKGIFPYEDMDNWRKFDKTTLPPKEDFYSNLNLENMSNEDYAHTQKVWEVFEIKNRGEYHDLYVQSDTLLVADVFENFRDKCVEIYKLDPAYFVSASGIAWKACLKKAEVKLELITDYDMLLMIEKRIRGGICYATHLVEVYIEYPKTLFNSHKDLPFIPERKKAEKVEKIICSIEEKEKYIIHIRALKESLNHGLKLRYKE